jgi:hypothetical protein
MSRQQSGSCQMTRRLDDRGHESRLAGERGFSFGANIAAPIWGRSFLLRPYADVSSRGEPSGLRSSSSGRVPRALVLVCFVCPGAPRVWAPSWWVPFYPPLLLMRWADRAAGWSFGAPRSHPGQGGAMWRESTPLSDNRSPSELHPIPRGESAGVGRREKFGLPIPRELLPRPLHEGGP